jgi:membrane protein DedA with SNARE-associated domain/rhodanese-related sulfurtransferase
MSDAIEFLVRHGYLILFAWVFIEQLGVPVPTIPLLLTAGALAGLGRLHLAAVIGLPVIACVSADFLWFQLGRRRGAAVLGWICRISLEPDSCVRRTEDFFLRNGAKSLLVAKFIPGLSLAAPPLAGIFRMPGRRFLLFDGAGSFLWAGAYTLLGFVFSEQLERVAGYALRLGESLGVLLGCVVAAYVIWKYIQRARFLRELRVAMITPTDLKKILDEGTHPVEIVDMRHAYVYRADPRTIPGAVHFDPKDIEENKMRIAPDRDVILYCTCPNEATSARVALLLRKRGFARVRPLEGGLAAWRRLGYPLELQAEPDPRALRL